MTTKRELLAGQQMRTFGARLELRATQVDGKDGLHLDGYASVTETPYQMWDFTGPYTEVISAGAFAKTIGERADVALLLNHGGMTLARTKPGTLRLAEDDTGLHVEADMDPRMTAVSDMRYAMERGDLDEMSFAFSVTRQKWSPDYTELRIDEVDLNKGDVSVVNYGANPATSVALRARDLFASKLSPRRARAMLTALQQERALSAPDAAVMAQILGMAASIDLIVDEMQEDLAEALGVENPDDEADDTARAKNVSRLLMAGAY